MRTLLLFLLFCMSGGAWADCSGGSTDVYQTFDMGIQYVPRDAPIGSVIGTANLSHSYKPPSNIVCWGGDTWETRQNPWPKVTGVSLPPITGLDMGNATILKTNVPGVGLVVIAPTSYLSEFSASNGVHPFVPFALTVKPPRVNSVSFGGPFVTRFTLIKISDEIPMGSSEIKNSTTAVSFWSGNRRFHSVFLTGRVIRSECSLAGGANAYIEVPMGEVKRSQFNGKDSYTSNKDLLIPLTNCIAGTYPKDQGWNYYQSSNAHLRLDGVQGSVTLDASRGILGLTTDSTAKGVAVQVLLKDGSTPFPLGQEVAMGALSGTGMNIELKARYIQTSDTPLGPEPGKANARAAFTLTYK